MSLPNSVLRRYTPPTCTLEIAAKGSPLSRWAGRPVLKHLRFQLSFDDPRLSPEEQVQVTGDRTQLEALCAAVDSYVQNFLDTTPTSGVTLGQPTPALSESLDPIESLNPLDHQHYRLNGDREEGHEAEREGARNGVSQNRPGDFAEDFDENRAATAGIYLQPKGLLSHNLCLGELSSTESNVVRLSALQLFDLANALDEYTAEAIALPALSRPSWFNATPAWAKVAAVLVLAVGVTTAIVKFVDPYAGQPAITTASEDAADEGTTAANPEITALEPLFSGKDPISPSSQPLNIPLPPPPGADTLPPANGLPSVGVPRTPTPNTSGEPGVPSAPTRLPDVAIAPPQQRSDAPGTGGTTPQLQMPTESEAAGAPPNAAMRSAAGRSDAQPSLESAPDQGDAASNSASTAFDTIPQVAEARTFFQDRWQPPESLTQTLQYRLQLSADGSIQRIIPLGQAAGAYIDRTGIPLPGEPFVSPVETGGNPQIRIVLEPDGRVQTFLESP